jgi:hypothetical protein
MFFKLLKDENAEMRSKFEAGRFIEGMVSFASKAELLGLLDDNRYYGSDRLKEALAFIEDNREIDEILVPMVMCLVDEEINRPLYKKARIRIVATIYSVPGLFSHLTEPDILEMLSPHSAQIICSLLELMVMTLVEARNCKDVQTLAKSFKKDGVDGAEKLCNLLLINENGQTPPQAESLSFTSSSVVACWVSDKRPPGGRHDNDHENYRDVRLVPTQEEISCETPPWLPLFSQENAVIENLEMRLLDTNFRLLREDAVASIRSNIEEKKRVWNNARVVGLTGDYGTIGKGKVQPLSFIVQLGSSYARKCTNWERSRALPHEGIIALCDPVDKKVQRLGTITARLHKEKDKWLHDKYGPVIGVSFHNSEDIISSLQEVADNSAVLARAKLESRCSFTAQSWSQVEAQSWSQVEKLFLNYDLIEASGSFFSYRPILSALQEFASVPLARQLAHLNPENQRPDYIPSTMSMPKTEYFNGYSCDFDHWSTQEVVSNTSLDESQAAAIHHALTSKVALIQGPPGKSCSKPFAISFVITLFYFTYAFSIMKGTGKTFIGALIAEMIRENTDESILCVCYTNHALDQFLEHLYDNGDRKIVRIGGRSKSEKLQRFNLKELSNKKTQLDRNGKQRMSSVFAKLCQHQEKIDKLSSELKKEITWNEPNGGFSELLKYENPTVYQHFAAIGDLPDGFEMIGKKNKKMQGTDVFEDWTKGSPCPDFLLPYVDLDPSLLEFWSLDKEVRGKMVDDWRALILDETQESLRDAVIAFQELLEEKETINREKDLQILKDARVIGGMCLLSFI